jgi:hypothetical protein
MSKPIMTIAVDKKGAAEITVKCVQGASCEQRSRFMEEALGLRTEEEKTAEYYQNPPETVRAHA